MSDRIASPGGVCPVCGIAVYPFCYFHPYEWANAVLRRYGFDLILPPDP